ncbi:phosphocholine-specific phospholipase C [Elizabethkingia miricola]|uniref:phosphocholine-specific phospholipase C n=1 Tax=Elizabethkingia miricola TaxID=172045 RepID=UPI003891CE1B
MDRRDFLKKSGMLLGGLGVSTVIHPSILKAMNIKPAKGSTFYDAEHVVILMQENRSFDHCFGTLRGVRGFMDKYAFRKPDGKSVFFQKDRAGKTYAPFNLDIKNTRATWMSSLPHSWTNQQNALNKGKYDQWLLAKRSGVKEYQDLPLTLGFYNRNDLPFYYQLADAFTVFDQYFCSSLTGTTPNRLFHWTGTIRAEKNGDVQAHVVNDTVDYSRNVHWKTFPEMLEENDISWRIYQNEISLSKGMGGEQEAYLSNFTDNPIEWFSQFNVKFSPKHHEFVQKKITELKDKLSKNPDNKERLEKELRYYEEDLKNFDPKNWEKLSQKEKNLHNKAFTINSGDPDFWSLEEIDPVNGEKMYLPKGDVLFQFRKDVNEGKLPAVSWLVAPERFSDHPSSQWYGAWFISEVMNILTKNPEVWKKTIFILNYDENDGYFDHVVPFLPPNNPQQQPDIHGEGGAEYVDFKQKYFSTEKLYSSEKMEGPIGLGYRVPMVMASPWTTGGYVNSEVSDHTSVLQFLEHFLNKKKNKNLHVENISDWRREVCGDLTSAFNQEKSKNLKLDFLQEKVFIESINAAKEKPVPNNFVALSDAEQNAQSKYFPKQEKGLKPSNPLPYHFEINFNSKGIDMQNHTEKATPVMIYNRKKLNEDKEFLFPYTMFKKQGFNHAVSSENGYDWEVFGPNGFYRNFEGDSDPKVEVKLTQKSNGDVEITFTSAAKIITLENAYTKQNQRIEPAKTPKVLIPSSKIGGWYDLKISTGNHNWIFAGRAETGKVSSTDPHWA